MKIIVQGILSIVAIILLLECCDSTYKSFTDTLPGRRHIECALLQNISKSFTKPELCKRDNNCLCGMILGWSNETKFASSACERLKECYEKEDMIDRWNETKTYTVKCSPLGCDCQDKNDTVSYKMCKCDRDAVRHMVRIHNGEMSSYDVDCSSNHHKELLKPKIHGYNKGYLQD